MGNNGESINGPTDLQRKQKAFESDPDRFVNLDDMILAVRRGSNGEIETFLSPLTRNELEVALMRITHQAFGIFNAMSYAAQKSKIVTPKGSIMDFVRKKR